MTGDNLIRSKVDPVQAFAELPLWNEDVKITLQPNKYPQSNHKQYAVITASGQFLQFAMKMSVQSRNAKAPGLPPFKVG